MLTYADIQADQAYRERHGLGFTAGHVYQVTDERLAVIGGPWYPTLTIGTHVIAESIDPGNAVLVAWNTRTAQRMWLRGERWVADHFRDLGPMPAQAEECACGRD